MSDLVPLHGRHRLKLGTLAARLAATSELPERPSVASDAGLTLLGNRIVAQPGQITPAAISAAGTTTPTLKAWWQRTQIFQTVSAGSGSYTAKLVLPVVADKLGSGTMTPPAGHEVILSLAMPASTNPTIEIRNSSGSGTVLATFTCSATARTVLLHAAFNGSEWVVQGFTDGASSLGFTPENAANKSTNVTTDAASDVKFPSVKAVKNYVDANAGGGFYRTGTVTKIVPAIPPGSPSPAHYEMDLAGATFADGETFEITGNTGSIIAAVFEWDDDSTVTSGHVAVLFNESTQAARIAQLRTAISGYSISGLTVGGSGTVIILESPAGAGTSLTVTCSLGGGAFDYSGIGSDGDPGSPESGTRLVTLAAGVGGKIHVPIGIDAPLFSGTSWTNGATIGWTDGTTFVPWRIVTEMATGIYSAQYWVTPGVPLPLLSGLNGFDLVLFTSNSVGVPSDEPAGDDFTIRVSGQTITAP